MVVTVHDAADPLEEFVEGIVAAMGAVPCQQEIDVLARVLELEGEVDGHGESGVAVTGTVADGNLKIKIALLGILLLLVNLFINFSFY